MDIPTERFMSFAKYKNLLKSFGFQSFLWTQFLGAFNDNIFKIVISMYAVNMAGGGSGSRYVAMCGAVFILPFCLFSGYAGYLADRYSKSTVLIVTKSIELVAVVIGLFAFWSGDIVYMLATLFLMALHSAFFSPAKYGILPEMLPDAELSRANGILEMSTFMAIILGTSIGTILFSAWKGELGAIGFFIVGVGIIGFITAFGITKVKRSGADKPFNYNPWSEIWHGLKRLNSDRMLLLTVAAITYFWFTAAILQMDILLLAKEVMHVSDMRVGILITFLAIGIGAGSIVAGRLSGDKVEPGLVPIGGIGMGVFSIMMSFSTFSYPLVIFTLVLLGFFGGLFMVPLNALLQHRSGGTEKGRMIATTNFVGTVGILFASVVLWLLRDKLDIQSHNIILIFGILTLAGAVFMGKALAQFLIRFSLWFITHLIYRIRIVGGEYSPKRGGALIVCNHISFVDGFLVGASIHRFVRYIIYRRFYDMRPVNWVMRHLNAIPVSDGNSRDFLGSIRTAREELSAGHVVCIFAEGSISRTGNLLPFKKGFEKIVEGLDVPVIPMHLDRVWGSVFSFKGGGFFMRNWLGELFRPITVSFGRPLPSSATAQEVREAVMELASNAVHYRRTPDDMLHLRFLSTVKAGPYAACMDDGKRQVTRLKAFCEAAAVASWIGRRHPGEEFFGVMLPPSVDAAIVNIGTLTAGRTPVNIDTGATAGTVTSIQAQCGIKTLVTSRALASRRAAAAATSGEVQTIYVEDILEDYKGIRAAFCAAAALILPLKTLASFYNRAGLDPGRLATVIFTRAQTGPPLGVMLTHHNIISNIEGFDQVFTLSEGQAVMSALPFSYSYGFTAALWYPLIRGLTAAHLADGTDGRAIATLASRHRAAMLLGYPEAFETVLGVCRPEDLKGLRYAIAGGAKVSEDLSRRFKARFGISLLEGYGTTELSPVLSVNIPDVEDRDIRQKGYKPGTMGQPIPGMAVKVVHPQTLERQPAGINGLLMVKGPSVMSGYFGNAEKTTQAFKDGWFATGVFASICDDGFIRVLGSERETGKEKAR
ncbi:MAG: MFS transporter [Deltaproteobacteria bacterium]|nr:MFS transporter [Deltaproteobacteria bacterium]